MSNPPWVEQPFDPGTAPSLSLEPSEPPVETLEESATSDAFDKARDGYLNLLDRIRFGGPLSGTAAELADDWKVYRLKICKTASDIHVPDLHEMIFEASKYSHTTKTPLVWVDDARVRQMGLVTAVDPYRHWWLYLTELFASLNRMSQYLEHFEDPKIQKLLDLYRKYMKTGAGRTHLATQVGWPRRLVES